MFVRATKMDRSPAWHYVLTRGGNQRRYEELRDQDSSYAWLETLGALQFVPGRDWP